ncbi:serine/threonine protein kinase [Saprolegnia diclina VS20]|uniref:Serine/threonine protein kinase n=1 Tax=Saprolegnia diclina (strain VS20) TaxID=1156394 RepID=T0QI37_SAPDV|nr:serine/threonine protein kinase [Saprolegnia diclina VS20]EQC37654.1 serine/threonine protein kinase [Saprolegnia diclina VS20]|eukprot:XP_008609174.1 serine/threonine protein kinase [Saprolegnia diclina VS20]
MADCEFGSMQRALLLLLSSHVAVAATSLQLCGTTPCVVYPNNSMTLLADNSTSFRRLGLETVQALPPSAARLDLSDNAISVIYRRQNSSMLQSLNVSHNRLVSLDALTSLSTLTTLDVSHNGITAFPSDTQLGQLSALTSLNLANNAITTLRLVSLPPQLAFLDLSDNPISTFEVSEAVYAALAMLPRESLRNISTTASCFATWRLLHDTTRVCVLDASSPGTAFLSTSYGILIVVLSALAIVAIAVLLLKRRYLCRRRCQQPELAFRDTRLSSNYSRVEENHPVEYRISLSVQVDVTSFSHQLTALKAHRYPIKDLKKLKLLTAPTLTTTTYAARIGNDRVDCTVLTPCASSPVMQKHLRGLVHAIRTLATLSHDNLVGFVGFAASPSLLDLALFTEPMTYGSLSTVFKDPSLNKYLHWTSSNALMVPKTTMARSVAAAVAYLHEKSIVHNAISTDTVFVSSTWHIKLGGLDQSANVVGADDAAQSKATDVYLLGRFFQALDLSNAGEPSDGMPDYMQSITAACLRPNPLARPTADAVVAWLSTTGHATEIASDIAVEVEAETAP